MAKMFSNASVHEPVKKGTSLGKKPITSTMNKHKRRSYKKYRGQGNDKQSFTNFVLEMKNITRGICESPRYGRS